MAQDMELSYLATDGTVKSRKLKLYTPEQEGGGKLPLIVAVHYEIAGEDPVLPLMLERGFAVLTPVEVPQEHLQNLAGDDFFFNLAVLDAAKRLEGIDKERIILRGGSAGGYQLLMDSAVHLGILCGYCLAPITNMAYEFRFLQANNKFNEDYAPTLPEEQRVDPANYPIPYVKATQDFIGDTGRYLGEEDVESDRWFHYSPVAHLNKLVQPIMFYHSSADIMVSINQMTERYIRRDYEANLPQGLKERMEDLMTRPELSVPLADGFDPAELDVFILNYDDTNLKFNSGKLFNLNIIDEGGKSRDSDHFLKSELLANYSELPYYEHYRGRRTAETNRLNAAKVEALADRYEGKLPVLADLNPYKAACEPAVYGSLASDRLDVLIGIAVYAGMNPDHPAAEPGPLASNLRLFAELYGSLDVGKRFIDNDIAALGLATDEDLAGRIARLIDHYRSMIYSASPKAPFI